MRIDTLKSWYTHKQFERHLSNWLENIFYKNFFMWTFESTRELSDAPYKKVKNEQ